MAQKWEMGKASDADDRLHHMLCHGNLQKQISAKFIFSYRVARKDSKLLPKQRAQGAQGQSECSGVSGKTTAGNNSNRITANNRVCVRVCVCVLYACAHTGRCRYSRVLEY